MYRWIGGKNPCVNLIGVSPFIKLKTVDFTVGQITLKTSSIKMVKHKKIYFDSQYVFMPFAFNNFYFLIIIGNWSFKKSLEDHI